MGGYEVSMEQGSQQGPSHATQAAPSGCSPQ